MTTKLIQRHSRLTLILSVMFVVSYTHALVAQYNDSDCCGCDEVDAAAFSDDVVIGLSHSTPDFSFAPSTDHPDSPTQGIPATSCQHSHCSPPVATLNSSFSRLEAVLSCSHIAQPTLSAPVPLSDGIDHPPS